MFQAPSTYIYPAPSPYVNSINRGQKFNNENDATDILKYELDLPTDLKSMLSDFFFSTLDEIDRYWKDTDPVISTIPSIDEEYFNRLIALVRYR